MFRNLLKVLPIVTLAAISLVAPYAVEAQPPFNTDDADVTEHGKFHFEIANEFDKLQASALPVVYQNGTRVGLAYGVAKNLEINLTGQYLALVSDPRSIVTAGVGDTTVGAKYKIRSETGKDRWPALAVSAFFKLPTGNAARLLGSGVADYGFNGIAQKTYRKKNVVRVNAGYLIGGNTSNGAIGLQRVRGHVFNGAASYVRQINSKLHLGGEVTGAVTGDFRLSKGQLQTQFGGNYSLSEHSTLDFGVIAGRFAASPRFGGQIGYSIDF